MLSIARIIAYVMVGSTHQKNAPYEMTKPMIEFDARLVDKWLLTDNNGHCKKCNN